MAQIIAGKKSKGKTKHLLDMANVIIRGTNGTVVYLDKSVQHMYELDNGIRLINVNKFPITDNEGLLGPICGTISQGHDLGTMYLDSFLKLSYLEGADMSDIYMILRNIGEEYHVVFISSISLDAEELLECVKDDAIVSLQRYIFRDKIGDRSDRAACHVGTYMPGTAGSCLLPFIL